MNESTLFEELGTLAGSRQRENQLSATFAACFSRSQEFRRVALGLLAEACQWSSAGRAGDWTVNREVVPKAGYGRVDLRLRNEATGAQVWLESKVEAVLTHAQVLKYKTAGVKDLVVLTKYEPDLAPSELRALGAYAIRWRDVHRALAAGTPRTLIDRWLCAEFARYLEALGMASNPKISTEDIRNLRRLLHTARSTHNRFYATGGFDTFSQLVEWLRGVRNGLIERVPRLEKCGARRAKFGIWHEGHSASNFFQVDFVRGTHSQWQVGFGLDIPVDHRAACWQVFWNVKGKNKEFESWPLARMFTGGYLDAAKFEVLLAEQIEAWNVR
jgi:hypothetical protein